MMDKDDRKFSYVEEKRFSIITKDSIKLIAEAAGHADIPEDVATLLGEDVSYRLREATHNGAQFMKHSKRRKMTTDDFNKGLKFSDVQPVHGYRSTETITFRQTKEGELSFVEDIDINFANVAFNNYVPKNQGETSIKAHWLAVEGVSKVSSAAQQSLNKSGKKEVTDDLQLYFDNVTNAILGCDADAMKIALHDLKTNPQIVPLLPFFVNFVSNGVKTVSHDISQLTKLLHTVKSLTSNPSLYLEPQPYLSLLVQGVTYCLLEPLAASINPTNDHWVLRDYAARLLAQIVMCWTSPINHLQYNTIRNLKEVLYDHTKPFCSHYGAVMGLKSLGYKPLEDVLIPHLPQYWPHLNAVMEDTSYANAVTKSDAHKVYGAMLLAVEFLLKKHISNFESEIASDKHNLETFLLDDVDSNADDELNKHSSSTNSSSVSDAGSLPSALQATVGQFYNDMYGYFGDSLAMRLPDLCEKLNLRTIVFVPKKKEVYVSLADPEASKSGEELLEEFMEQVKIQQQLDRERREQRRIEFERQEKLRKEREEKERLLREERRRKEIARQLEIEKQKQEKKLKLEQLRRMEMELQRQKQLQREREQAKRRRPVIVDTDEENNSDLSDEEVIPAPRKRLPPGVEQPPPAPAPTKSDNSSHSEEEQPYAGTSSSHMDLAVKSTVSDPGKGIKMKIIRQPPLKIRIKTVDPAASQSPSRDTKESKHGKKRKQSQKSSLASTYDAFDFDESDPEDFKPFKPHAHYYSSEGESSDGTGHRKLKLKLKVKDSKDFTSE